MIDPHWILEDLDPRTWRNLGRFINPGLYIQAAQPGERGLFILHDGGRVIRIVDTALGVRRDLGIYSVAEPQALAAELHSEGNWERVHVIDRRHLAAVARQAQATARRDLTLDQYYLLVYQLLWDGGGGYVCEPADHRRWNGWSYDDLLSFVGRLPAVATLALGVVDDGEVAIGLILELRDGMIRRVTTFEALDLPPGEPTISGESLERLWAALAQRFAPPAGVLLCTQSTFEAWIAQGGTIAVLEAAAAENQAVWRLLA
ncbi:MAG TPA: hypothetical protein VFO07_00520 [Roseiflexaceae bacterium]|nr:hypothetical protein [Roseiflexaceae bacterium]